MNNDHLRQNKTANPNNAINLKGLPEQTKFNLQSHCNGSKAGFTWSLVDNGGTTELTLDATSLTVFAANDQLIDDKAGAPDFGSVWILGDEPDFSGNVVYDSADNNPTISDPYATLDPLKPTYIVLLVMSELGCQFRAMGSISDPDDTETNNVSQSGLGEDVFKTDK